MRVYKDLTRKASFVLVPTAQTCKGSILPAHLVQLKDRRTAAPLVEEGS
jgi:hypothetical protein